jgi:excisionase family DNA binding protein
MSDLERDYLTAAEAAAILGLPGRTVRYRLERGIMRGVAVNPRLWLVPRAEVERWRAVGTLRAGRKPRPAS